MHEEYPEDELYFVIGADSLNRFNQWVNYEELLRYPFVVVERDDIDISAAMEKLNKQNYLIMRKVRNVSSTYIREHIDDNLDGMIDRGVLDILRDERMFRV